MFLVEIACPEPFPRSSVTVPPFWVIVTVFVDAEWPFSVLGMVAVTTTLRSEVGVPKVDAS